MGHFLKDPNHPQPASVVPIWYLVYCPSIAQLVFPRICKNILFSPSSGHQPYVCSRLSYGGFSPHLTLELCCYNIFNSSISLFLSSAAFAGPSVIHCREGYKRRGIFHYASEPLPLSVQKALSSEALFSHSIDHLSLLFILGLKNILCLEKILGVKKNFDRKPFWIGKKCCV